MIDSIILEDIKMIEDDLRKAAFEDSRILIAGGAGFIGSWICDVLVGLGSEVVCLDNFSTGKMENINHLLGEASFKFIEDDVCSFHGEAKYDYILHFASRASPEEYKQHPVKTLNANSLGSNNMLELARKHDAGIMFASSSEVYGEAHTVPTPETYWGNVNSIGIRSCYDEGKRFGEAMFMAYHRQYGLDVRIARIFNTFGPRLRAEGTYGRAVSRFTVQALSEKPITVYGDGTQTRAFCYVTDTVLGLLLFCTEEGASGEVLNIGSPKETTILELAHETKRRIGSASSITFHPLSEDDPKRRCPDISKAERILGWGPKLNLELGLDRTIIWFQKNGGLV